MQGLFALKENLGDLAETITTNIQKYIVAASPFEAIECRRHLNKVLSISKSQENNFNNPTIEKKFHKDLDAQIKRCKGA